MPAVPGDQQLPRSEEVFISYSRKDKEFVRRLDEELRRRDREAWVDWEGIPPGDTWEKTIYGAIEASHTFIFVLTPDSIASEVCGREIAHAAANNKRLVPIVHRDVAADRVPRGESIVRPRSHCRSCGRLLTVVDLLPVAGYLLRRGRCAHTL